GTEQKPAVTVTAGETTLVDGTDYELTYSNNIDAGDATVTVTCQGNYAGMATEDFDIAKAALTLDTVTVDEKDYNGKVDDVNITAVVFAGLQNGETLTLGTDFTLSNVIYTSPNANESAEVTGTVALADTDKANNYELDAGAFLTTGKVDKAALSITAKDHTIVYGDAPANSGVDYAGFVNGETTSVLGGELAYDYAYAQYGDVGAYAITPKGLTSDNYAISFLTGELTVEQKEVALTWTGAGTQYYDGTEKTVTAAVADGYLVNGDEVAVTVTGGKQTSAGTYVAVATALTGAKAGNYKLPAEVSADFEIVDVRSASVTFTLYNGTTQTVEYAAEDLMTQLPVDSRPGYRFAGWKFKGNGVEIDNQTYTQLTDALLTALDAAAEPLTAEPRFASIPSSSTKQNYTIKATAGEGGTISPAGEVTVAKGESVTFTFTPEAGYRVKTVKVDKKVVTADSGYTFETVKSNHTIEVTYEKIQYVNPFTDVDAGKYYYDAVLWAVEKGITLGTTDTTFEPTAICNRGQMVTFLWRAAGKPEPKTTENPFTDVSEDAYYYKAVLWAVENGITNGLTATYFGPAQACTRGQMATFLWRAGGKQAPTGKTSAFTDVDTGKYYYDAVLWAAERGITLGKTATTFVPAEACNRGQMVTFLYRNELAK
ncbi:MAG: S-layer homology domain-containing protein, partial [Ruminococcaceae bacterium]|nr:S-layer homology domain-containing protein [Oscillospiraceae bacterium]